MDDLLSEKEQIEEFKKFWREYGSFILGGIAIGVAALFGWYYYQSNQAELQIAASDRYETLTQQVSDGDLDAAEATAAELSADYGDTAYAAQAGLAMARLYMDKNRDQDAADALLATIEGGADPAIAGVARARLARIYLYQEKPELALELLSGADHAGFGATFNEIRGDALAALERIDEAEAAYQAVLADPLAEGTVELTLVQWKLLDLPTPVADGAAEPEPAEAGAVETPEPEAEESE